MTRLVNRNVTLAGRRTSMRLEPEFWAILDMMARDMKKARGAVVQMIKKIDGTERGELTSAVRVRCLRYAAQMPPTQLATTEDKNG